MLIDVNITGRLPPGRRVSKQLGRSGMEDFLVTRKHTVRYRVQSPADGSLSIRVSVSHGNLAVADPAGQHDDESWWHKK